MSVVDLEAPSCGTLGCRKSADVEIHHPKKGRLTVCDDCATGYVVIRDV